MQSRRRSIFNSIAGRKNSANIRTSGFTFFYFSLLEVVVTYRSAVVLREVLVDVALDEAGLSGAQLADHQQLEEVLTHLGHVRRDDASRGG